MWFEVYWFLLGVVLLGFYNALLIKDDKTPENSPDNTKIEKDWHRIGASLFAYLTITFWIHSYDFRFVLFGVSAFWFLFAGIVHMVGLKKDFFYVGETAYTDKLFRKVFPNNPILASKILKTALFVVSALLFLL
jgi:hypothetical protein